MKRQRIRSPKVLSFASFGKRKIHSACAGMSQDFAREFKRAFSATGSMDLYGGDPVLYMRTIAQTLERYKETQKICFKVAKLIVELEEVGS